MMDVEIENIDSWPPDFREAAVQSMQLVISYHAECLRIGKYREGEDVFLQIHPPDNRYKQDYRALVKRLEALLLPHRIVSYHCTRLTQEEIVDIRQEGLRVLTTDLVDKRLEQCLSHGYLEQAAYERIKNSPHLSESLNDKNGKRTDMIHFCANRSTLQDCVDVYRLFRSWGGEALYWGHEQDAYLAPVLGRIGIPCIVVCAIPFKRVKQPYYEFPEYFLSYMVSEEIEHTCLSSTVNPCTEENLCSSEILDIIRYSDSRFEELTSEASWPEQFQINAPVSD